jgi:hypothetical protein
MAKKQRKYNAPPRIPVVRCAVCYQYVGEGRFYNHISTACGAGSKKKDM